MPFKDSFHQILWALLIFESVGCKKTDDTVFEKNYCDIKCDGEVHTMCPIKNPVPACDDFELHRIDSDHYREQLEILVHGHNGVRNRIAERMHVPNMLEMKWDGKLALMAENYLYKCRDRITDPCTLKPEILLEEETVTEFFKFNITPKYIAQNTFYEKSHFYPFKFLERVIRSWYFEKDGMRQPINVEDVDSDYQVERLLGENNFTHFAYPYVYRFGCAMAKFNDGFHILCNYYPFYRTITNTMYFHTGIPAVDCPARFPLVDDMFTNLCTDESNSYFENENSDDKASLRISFGLWTLSVLESTVLIYVSIYN